MKMTPSAIVKQPRSSIAKGSQCSFLSPVNVSRPVGPAEGLGFYFDILGKIQHLFLGVCRVESLWIMSIQIKNNSDQSHKNTTVQHDRTWVTFKSLYIGNFCNSHSHFAGFKAKMLLSFSNSFASISLVKLTSESCKNPCYSDFEPIFCYLWVFPEHVFFL